jgi:hypothetical protein
MLDRRLVVHGGLSVILFLGIVNGANELPMKSVETVSFGISVANFS